MSPKKVRQTASLGDTGKDRSDTGLGSRRSLPRRRHEALRVRDAQCLDLRPRNCETQGALGHRDALPGATTEQIGEVLEGDSGGLASDWTGPEAVDGRANVRW